MRSTCLAALLVMTAPAVAVGCGGANDPLGGPYGGTMTNVAPNLANENDSVSVNDDAGGGGAAPASSSSSTSSTSSSTSSSSSSGSSTSGGKSSSGSSSGHPSNSSGGSSTSSGSGGTSGGSTTSSSGSTTSSSGNSSGSTTSSSGGMDAGTSTSSTAPTWTEIYTNYLKSGTPGNCNTACHFQMSSAKSAYQYLQGQGYINGPGSILAKTGSCLSWYGGNMPPGGPRTEAMATTDMSAWAAAGAMDN